MKKLLCLLFGFMTALVIFSGRADAWEQTPVESEVLGIRHMAGIDTDRVLDLADEDKPQPEPQKVSLGTFTVTAYCACKRCCGKEPSDPAYGITATGTVATEGRTIAVDPSVIPYGTVVYIDGQAYVAEDCGGGIKGRQIDLYFEAHEDAKVFGVQELEIFID